MRASRLLVVLIGLSSSCSPAMLPRLQVAVTHGRHWRDRDERGATEVWLRLSWGEPESPP